MTDSLAISIAQLDPVVGDIAGNLAKLKRALKEAEGQGADLVVASELFVSGYPPEDLVLKPAFVASCQGAIQEFAKATRGGPAVLLGSPWTQDGKLYNAALLLAEGKVASLALQARAAELRRVRRETRLRRRARARAGGVQGRAAGRHGLRGHVVPGLRRDPGRKRRGDAHRHQRLALRARQAGRARDARDLAHQRNRPAAALRQPGGRPGRAGVRRRLLRARRRLRAPGAGAELARGAGADALEARAEGLGDRARHDGKAA